MRFIPTTTVSILRGTTTDGYGDPQDAATVAASGIPASIVEETRTVRTRGDSDPRVVHNATIRVPYGTDVRDDDRILDEQSSLAWPIDAVSRAQGHAFQNDIRITSRQPQPYAGS